MAANPVNLDALIPRQDFLSSEGPGVGESEKKSVSITDLRKGESFFASLRKPDFQRETAAWAPQSVCDFVKSFIESDLIPTVICWQNPARLSFVIDGAHRLSAIIAWILNDFGDGTESRKFYGGQIPLEQQKIALKTQQLIQKEVGLYHELISELQNPGTYPELAANARALAHAGIPLQWIKSADWRKAERAFFTINQSAVSIDPTELKILNARTEPNSVAARAIVRNSTGHKYWEKFSAPAQVELETAAKKIYSLLYSPPLDTATRTIELPIAGHGYGSQTLPLIFDFVNIANNLPVKDPSQKPQKLLPDERPEAKEEEVLNVLRNAEKLAQRMTGLHVSSLGLLPAIYFYSSSGKHQPTAVMAIAFLIMELNQKDKLLKFTSVRKSFEEFLKNHKMYVNQVTVKYGSMAKGFRQLKDFYELIIDQLLDGKNDEEIEKFLNTHIKYHFLKNELPTTTTQIKNFSKNAKQLVFLDEAINCTGKCPICGARKDNKSITADHSQDKKYGGLATTDNLQFVHPFCNSAKDALAAMGVPSLAHAG